LTPWRDLKQLVPEIDQLRFDYPGNRTNRIPISVGMLFSMDKDMDALSGGVVKSNDLSSMRQPNSGFKSG